MPRLKRRLVRAWLDREEAEKLDQIAKREGMEPAAFVERVLAPHLEAGCSERVFQILISNSDIDRLKSVIRLLCENESSFDIDEEVQIWIDSLIKTSIDEL